MKRASVIQFVCFLLVGLFLISVPGCGQSKAYKEGNDNATHFISEMKKTCYQTGTSFSTKDLPDPDEIEKETGTQAIPYREGSSDRTEWLRGYRDAVKKASSD